MNPRRRMIFALSGAVILIIILVGVWQFGPLKEYANPQYLAEFEKRAAATPWAPLVAIGFFVVGGLLAMPLSVIIVVTALAFGPVKGTIYSYIGCNLSALVCYWLGVRYGARLVPHVVPREHLEKIESFLSRRGFTAMLAMRLSPVGHFTIESLVAGFLKMPFRAFFLATLIGTIPEVLIVTTLGHAAKSLLHLGRTEDAVIIIVVAACLVLAYVLHRRRAQRRGSRPISATGAIH